MTTLALSALQYRGYGGAGTYVEHLLSGLAGLGRADLQVRVFGDAAPLELLRERSGDPASVTWHTVALPIRELQIRRVLKYVLPGASIPKLEAAVRALEPDAVLYPQQDVLATVNGVPTLVTFLDLLHLDRPDLLPANRRYAAFLRRLKDRRSVDDARRIITISQYTADRVAHHWPQHADRVRSVPLAGLDPDGQMPEPEEGRYFLYPATTHPHKNHATLVRAFLDSTGLADMELRLVGTLVGRHGRELEATFAGTRVRWLGRVSKERLLALYRGATAVVVPSLFEGYGLPVEEAIRLGAPVLCNDIPVFHEVSDGADVTFFDAGSETATRAALEAFSRRAKTPTRGSGPRRSWADVARDTLDVLDEVWSG